jgi:2-phospho-L-lactate transferase/gluconeogenesis factor (CofD/UPF0052 family)
VYSQLVDRIDNDRVKIAEIGPTGRYRMALQWYKDDLRTALRDLRNYRFQMETIPVKDHDNGNRGDHGSHGNRNA